jgi:hypothetical protein
MRNIYGLTHTYARNTRSAAYVGWIAGAIMIDDYRAGLLAAGFEDVDIVDSRSDLNDEIKQLVKALIGREDPDD